MQIIGMQQTNEPFRFGKPQTPGYLVIKKHEEYGRTKETNQIKLEAITVEGNMRFNIVLTRSMAIDLITQLTVALAYGE